MKFILNTDYFDLTITQTDSMHRSVLSHFMQDCTCLCKKQRTSVLLFPHLCEALAAAPADTHRKEERKAEQKLHHTTRDSLAHRQHLLRQVQTCWVGSCLIIPSLPGSNHSLACAAEGRGMHLHSTLSSCPWSGIHKATSLATCPGLRISSRWSCRAGQWAPQSWATRLLPQLTMLLTVTFIHLVSHSFIHPTNIYWIHI